MGFGATENGQYGLLPVFEALSNLSNALGGVCMHQNILFLEFGYFGLWRTHLQNYTFWGPLRSTVTLLSRTKKFIFQCQLRPKMTIKGMKKIEIKGAEIRKKVVISLCLFRYGTFFEYKTIAKKTCAPKTRATLAMPNILFVSVCCLCVVWCKHFCAPINFKFKYVL